MPITFDSQTIQTTGAFFIGELERLDTKLHQPLVSYTWSRDIDLREDVTIADEMTSFIMEHAGITGTPNPKGKNWIGGNSTAIAGVELSGVKTGSPMTLWGLELGYSIKELAAAEQTGRSIDERKHRAIVLKYNMDMDEQTYIGDAALGVDGLVNHRAVVTESAGLVWAEGVDKEALLLEFNEFITAAYLACGSTFCPERYLLPATKFAFLASQQLSKYTDRTLLSYLKENCIATAINGKAPEFYPSKWLETAGAGGKTRMAAYTKNPDYVRLPATGLDRTPTQHRGLHHLTYFYANIGAIEVVQPETLRYLDGI